MPVNFIHEADFLFTNGNMKEKGLKCFTSFWLTEKSKSMQEKGCAGSLINFQLLNRGKETLKIDGSTLLKKSKSSLIQECNTRCY